MAHLSSSAYASVLLSKKIPRGNIYLDSMRASHNRPALISCLECTINQAYLHIGVEMAGSL